MASPAADFGIMTCLIQIWRANSWRAERPPFQILLFLSFLLLCLLSLFHSFLCYLLCSRIFALLPPLFLSLIGRGGGRSSLASNPSRGSILSPLRRISMYSETECGDILLDDKTWRDSDGSHPSPMVRGSGEGRGPSRRFVEGFFRLGYISQ